MNNNGQDIQEKEGIDLLELLGLFWKGKWLILILVVLFANYMYIKTEYFTSDSYTANGVLYVSNRSEESAAKHTDTVSGSDINTSRQLSATYMELLRTRSFLETVAKDVYGEDGAKYWRSIYGMSTVASVNETELLMVSITAGDPDTAYKVAKSFVHKAPSKLLSVYKSGEVYIVDEPIKPTSPNGKASSRQGAIGAFIGAAIAVAFIFIRNFFDNRVHNSEDVAKRYNITILGETYENE